MPSLRSLVAWLVVAPWAVWAVARVLGLERGFPFVQLMAFTPYAALLALVGGVVALVLRRRIPAMLAAATVVVLGVVLAPRAIGDGGEAQADGSRLRVMTANVYRGRASAEALVGLVRRERVDVLVVQELTPSFAREAEQAGLERELPNAALGPGVRGGSGVYSHLPLDPLPTFQGSKSEMRAASVTPPGAARVDVISVHVAVPLSGDDIPGWRTDLRALPASAPSGPVQVLAGDFNSTLDHDELRELVARGYRDAAEVAGSGFAFTWRGRLALPVTIDHVLAPERVGVASAEVHDLPGSDHNAVLAELILPPA